MFQIMNKMDEWTEQTTTEFMNLILNHPKIIHNGLHTHTHTPYIECTQMKLKKTWKVEIQIIIFDDIQNIYRNNHNHNRRNNKWSCLKFFFIVYFPLKNYHPPHWMNPQNDDDDGISKKKKEDKMTIRHSVVRGETLKKNEWWSFNIFRFMNLIRHGWTFRDSNEKVSK